MVCLFSNSQKDGQRVYPRFGLGMYEFEKIRHQSFKPEVLLQYFVIIFRVKANHFKYLQSFKTINLYCKATFYNSSLSKTSCVIRCMYISQFLVTNSVIYKKLRQNLNQNKHEQKLLVRYCFPNPVLEFFSEWVWLKDFSQSF